MPSANIHNTKNIAIELLCSSSAELLPGKGAASDGLTSEIFVADEDDALTWIMVNIEELEGPMSYTTGASVEELVKVEGSDGFKLSLVKLVSLELAMFGALSALFDLDNFSGIFKIFVSKWLLI